MAAVAGRPSGFILVTVMTILVALSVITAMVGNIATMEAQLAGNFKRSVSGSLGAGYAALETLQAFQDFAGARIVGPDTSIDTAWSAAYLPASAAIAYGGAVIEVTVRAAREYDLKRYGLGYADSDYVHHQNGAPDWDAITAGRQGRVVYFGYGDAADPGKRAFYTTDAATMNQPVLMAQIPNRFGAGYEVREFMMLRTPGPPLYATVAVTSPYTVTTSGGGYISAGDAACGSLLNAVAISEGGISASMVEDLYAQYQAYATEWDGAASVEMGVYELSGTDVRARGAGILLVPDGAKVRMQSGAAWNGVVISRAEAFELLAHARIDGAVLADGDVSVSLNAAVEFDGCRISEALGALPTFWITPY